MTITQYDGQIDSDEVRDRIRELEGELPEDAWTIVRDRTGLALTDETSEALRFETYGYALEYLQDEDYDQSRFTITEDPGDPDLVEELAELRDLDELGSSITDWRYGTIVLSESKIEDGDFWRERAIDSDDISRYSPFLDYIDWEEYGSDMAGNLESFTWKGYTFYSL